MHNSSEQWIRTLAHRLPTAYAEINGSNLYPEIHGTVCLYPLWQGTMVLTNITGLPDTDNPCEQYILGFHIHEGFSCTGPKEDPFADTKGHFNPHSCKHPNHTGDLPPLFSCHGIAIQGFYTDRFYPEEIIGRTIVIHHMADDFRSQPSGNAGMKIACGVIREINI